MSILGTGKKKKKAGIGTIFLTVFYVTHLLIPQLGYNASVMPGPGHSPLVMFADVKLPTNHISSGSTPPTLKQKWAREDACTQGHGIQDTTLSPET